MFTYRKRGKRSVFSQFVQIATKNNINTDMIKTENEQTIEKSISLLLGAGFSAPKGYPVGSQLNDKLLTCAGDNFTFSPCGTLVINNDGTKPNKNQYDCYFDFCADLINYYNDIH